MKAVALFTLLCSLVMARGQSTNAPAAAQVRTTNAPAATMLEPDPLSVELSKQLQPSVIQQLQSKPNEMSLGRVKASGIAVEAVKTKQPLKLINPLSPPANSSPEDNVVRDPFNGKVNGLKVFAIHF